MEEQQIQDFVSRVSHDECLRSELANNAEAVIEREHFSPRVAQIIAKMVPHLAFGNTSFATTPYTWWYRS